MDDRRKRLLYRSTHRGMKESDLLLGGYARLNLESMDDDALAQFECLLDESDNDLMSWILETTTPPVESNSSALRDVIAYKKML